MQISTLQQFETYLQTRIPTRDALFQGDLGIKRMKYFMRLLGNPQNKLRVIHIAGTSGKGSTCYLISHILQSQGFNVGLSISPHVFDMRERMQINNALPAEKLVLKYFNQILPTIQKMQSCKYGAPTFFEINVGLAYFMFAQEKLDYAVMETGLGGLLDGTNCASNKNKICLITKIGLDHTEILGKTISKITEQKAGIIKKQNITISIQQAPSAKKVITNKCKENQADLYFINKKNYSIISSTAIETVFNSTIDSLALRHVKLGLIGQHQAENCSLALACLNFLAKRDKFTINQIFLRETLANIKIPGRFEIRKIRDKALIIDGAHNPQKMQALTSNLAKLFPNQKFIFILAFKKGKDFQAMLNLILPLAEKIYLSSFSTSNQDNQLSSIANDEILKFLALKNYSQVEILARDFKIEKLIKKSNKPIVITGSLYFISLF